MFSLRAGLTADRCRPLTPTRCSRSACDGRHRAEALWKALLVGMCFVGLREAAGADSATPLRIQSYLDRNFYTAEKSLRASVRLEDKAEQPLTAELEIRPAGRPAIKARAALDKSGRALIQHSLSEVPVGRHPVVLRVLDVNGAVLAEQTTMLGKEKPAPNGIPEVKADRERLVALVDGRPFFPIGIYGVPADFMKPLAEAGFNCTVRWFPGWRSSGSGLKKAIAAGPEETREHLNAYLDACQAAGLRVLECPTAFGFGYDGLDLHYRSPRFAQDFMQFMRDPLPQVLRSVCRHPAILAYYGPDEPGEYPVRELSAKYSQIVASHDPYRPNYYLFYGKIYDWTEAYDMAGIDYYGIGRRPALATFTAVRKQADTARRLRIPYWHVPLCEWCSASQRGLTGPEQRIQSYLSVIGGAKGMLWWVWPPRGHDNWEQLKSLAREFQRLSPVLLEASPEYSVEHVSPAAAESVQALVQEHAGKTYLVTANASPGEVAATFELPRTAAGRCDVWFEQRGIEVRDGRFSDRFEGYSRHVYELEGRWPAGGVLRVSAAPTGRTSPGAAAILGPKRVAASSKNLVPNAGFEAAAVPHWPDYWEPGFDIRGSAEPGFVAGPEGLWTTDRREFHEGQQSLRMTRRHRAAPDDYARLRAVGANITYLPVRQGGDHTFSVWLKADRPNTVVRLWIGWKFRDVRVSNEWARYSFTTSLAAKAASTEIQVELRDQATLWVDAAQLEEGAQATPFTPSTPK